MSGAGIRGWRVWAADRGQSRLRLSPPRRRAPPFAWIVCLGSLALVSGAGGGEPSHSPAQVFVEQALFVSGRDGYHTYRIPALAVTGQGTILAFCEARKNSSADHGDVDLALRRSVDGGRTWEKMHIIADDGEHTVGNPCPVVDRRTGTIWLPYCRDNKRVLLKKSTTDGQTWSEPVDVTADVVNPSWHWVGTGPGHGVQLASGRLLIPCWADATPSLGEIQLSFVFFSDDGGRRWRPGGALVRNASDECEVVERTDGSLYMTMRSRQGKQQRAWATSSDGGAAWSAVAYDPALPEPSCQGSVVRLSDHRVEDRDRVLLASPASPKDRTQLTVRMSNDECRTWPVARVVHAGSSAYSDLAVTLGREVLLLYEADNYGKLVLARFNVEWLSDGRDSPAQPIR